MPSLIAIRLKSDRPRAIGVRSSLVVLLFAPLLASCAANPDRMIAFTDSPKPTFQNAWTNSLCMRAIGGGEKWSLLAQAGVVEDDAFRKALESSLQRNQLLAQPSACKYYLDSDILGISQPGQGLFITSVTTEAHVNYKIFDGDQKPVFVDTVSSSYTEPFALNPGIARMQYSAEGAVRTNLEKFLKNLAGKSPSV